MSGIDKIIATIEADTNAVCDRLLLDARMQADAMIEDSRQSADALIASFEEKTAAAVLDIENRGRSTANIVEKKILLSEKQQIIADMIDKALSDLKLLPDDAYFELIYQMIEKHMQQGTGLIRFNQRDLSRLPADFSDKLGKISDGKLSLSEEPIGIDAGFVLVYGGIEENCSFDAIVLSMRETIFDRAAKLLF